MSQSAEVDDEKVASHGEREGGEKASERVSGHHLRVVLHPRLERGQRALRVELVDERHAEREQPLQVVRVLLDAALQALDRLAVLVVLIKYNK